MFGCIHTRMLTLFSNGLKITVSQCIGLRLGQCTVGGTFKNVSIVEDKKGDRKIITKSPMKILSVFARIPRELMMDNDSDHEVTKMIPQVWKTTGLKMTGVSCIKGDGFSL